MAHTDPKNLKPAAHDPFHGKGLAAAHRATPAEQHPERHEHTDVPTRPLKLFFVVMLITGLVVQVGLYWLFQIYKNAEDVRDEGRVRSALARSREDKLPPEPRLQGVPTLHDNTPRQDAELMRVENERLLNEYHATTDGSSVQLPVDRAMDLALRRGFKKNPSAATTRPATSAGESGH